VLDQVLDRLGPAVLDQVLDQLGHQTFKGGFKCRTSRSR
jgi:hypothetical protein